MKYSLIIALLFSFHQVFCQVALNANGSSDTYSLISSVLAPGHNPIETPDCGHTDFGDHIDEIFDNDLNDFVFQFHIHTALDNDRCRNFDRQRNEIKSYDKSPDNLLGVEGETVIYKWKFKLKEGFQSSPNFTHLHQLKSVGGSLASMPMYTLTTRKGTPDKLELRYAETDSQITLKKTDLAPFIGTWLAVTETITYGLEGTYEILINSVETNHNLFSYSTNSIINWRMGADFVRPKWGIYRSLLNEQDLRDETVLFANFSVEEIEVLATSNSEVIDENLIIFHIPDNKTLYLQNYPKDVELIQILSINGQKIMNYKINSQNELHINIASLTQGIYVVHLVGKETKYSKLIAVAN